MDDTPSDFPFDPIVKRKRGGRKAGSKNKPKPTGAVAHVAELSLDLASLRAQIEAMRVTVQQCCTLLQQAMSLRVGMMDSESRAHDIAKQRSMLEQQAHDQLRGML